MGAKLTDNNYKSDGDSKMSILHFRLVFLSFMIGLGVFWKPSSVMARDIEYRQVVFAMRHGIRHATSSPDLQLYAQNRNWASWYTTQYGCLTVNGLKNERLLGSYYRDVLINEGLIQNGGKCPVDPSYYIRADSFQRTWWSARGLADGLFPNCQTTVYAINADAYKQQAPKVEGDQTCTSENDPLFFPLQSGTGAPQMNPTEALLASAATIGAHGDASTVTTRLLTDAYQEQIKTLQAATDCCQPSACPNLPVGEACTLDHLQDTLVADSEDVTLNGPVNIGNDLSAIFLMAYQDGLPMKDVAFGMLTLDQLNPTYALTSAAFGVMYHTPYAAKAQMSNWMNQILLALTQRAEDKKRANAVALPSNSVVVFVGHDDNLSGLGSLMNVSWINAGYQPNLPAAGSGFVFTLIEDRQTKNNFVKVEFVAQSPDQQRSLEQLSSTNPPSIVPLQVPGCESPQDLPYYCPLAKFTNIVRRAMSPKYITQVSSLR